MRKLNHVTFHLTNACNLSCRHCWVNAGRCYLDDIDELSINQWKDIIKQCKELGVGIIRFTGGEPLIKKGVEELFAYCYEIGIPFQIETNGIMLSKNMIQQIKNNGVRFITVSLDSATKDFHDYFRNKRGAFDGVINAIGLLDEYEIPFQVIMCVCKENIHQIPDVIKLCEKYRMNSLKINPVNDNEYLDESITLLDIKEILELNENIKECRKHTNLNIVFPIPYAFSSVNELISTKPFGCDICNRLAIMPDGKVSLCGVGISAPEVIMGDVKISTIAEIWDNSKLLDIIEKDIPSQLEGVCQHCIHKHQCRGYCRAFPILQSHNLFASFHVCQKAYEEGLFPLSRMI